MPEKAPPVVHEFWLSSTITECTIDTATQTAEAKFLSKWHFVDKDFANKVKRGERVLVDESGSNVKAEEVSELVEKGDMLRGYMLKMGVDEKNRSEHPSEKFPVNIDAIFSNLQGKPEVLHNLCWLGWTKSSGTVTIQLGLIVTIHCDFDLAFFPYDKHVLPFALETRSWKHNKQDHVWKLCATEPEWADNLAPIKHYGEDNAIVSMKMAEDPQFYFDPPCAFVSADDVRKKPILCLQIQRKPKFFILRVTIPVFIVVCIALLCFAIRGRSFEWEFNATFISMLTITAFAQTIQDDLPTLPYMTLGDFYFLFGYFYHLIICAKTVGTSHWCDDGDGYAWVQELTNIERGSGPVRDDVRDSCEVVDRFTIALMMVWLAIHLIVWTDARLPRAYRPSTYMSPSYKKLAIRFGKKMKHPSKKGTIEGFEAVTTKSTRESSMSYGANVTGKV